MCAGTVWVNTTLEKHGSWGIVHVRCGGVSQERVTEVLAALLSVFSRKSKRMKSTREKSHISERLPGQKAEGHLRHRDGGEKGRGSQRKMCVLPLEEKRVSGKYGRRERRRERENAGRGKGTEGKHHEKLINNSPGCIIGNLKCLYNFFFYLIYIKFIIPEN